MSYLEIVAWVMLGIGLAVIFVVAIVGDGMTKWGRGESNQ